MSTNAAAPAQSGGLPPVEDADIKPQGQEAPVEQSAETKEATEKTGSKTEEKGTKSQPQPKDGEAKEKGPGPWDAELAKRGIADPNVDAFLREVVQPYVTQLEQGGDGEIDQLFGNRETAGYMAEFLAALREDPVQAYRDLGELLGLADADLGELGGEGDEQLGLEGLGAEGEDGMEEPATPFDEEREYVRSLIAKEQEAQEDAQYNELLQQIGSRIPGFDENLFTRMMIAAGGNRDTALSWYMEYHKAPAPTEEAPPTLEGGAPPPREAPRYNSIDDALDAVLAEGRAARPTR